MDISAWDLYWVFRLDNIHNLLTVTIGVTIILAAVGSFILTALWEDKDKQTGDGKVFRWARTKYLPTCLVLLLALIAKVFLPTTREMAAIVVLPRLAQSQVVTEKLPAEAAELYGMLKQWLKKEIAEDAKEAAGVDSPNNR